VRSANRGRLRSKLGALLALSTLSAIPAGAVDSGAVHGTIRFDVADVRMADLGPFAVYLEPLGHTPEFVTPDPVKIDQRDATFDPGFVVVVAGQEVSMPNRDSFYHNVFSYSRPNDFDLGLYSEGERRSLVLRHPGVVRIYCSIHESMRAVILVSPTPWFDRVDRRGSFRIANVPPGRYRIQVFNEALPPQSRDLTVRALESTRVEIAIGERRDPAG
jgi:plastocyanin